MTKKEFCYLSVQEIARISNGEFESEEFFVDPKKIKEILNEDWEISSIYDFESDFCALKRKLKLYRIFTKERPEFFI